MIPLDVYRTYLSVRNHFTNDNYNFFKFGGKTKASSSAFEKRRDRYIFDKVSKDYKDDEVALLFVSNFVAKEKFWIGNALSEESRNIYTMWRKKIQSLSYIFENDVKAIIDEINDREIDFDSVFKIQDGQHPIILRLTLADRISLESFLILNKILDFFPQFNRRIEETIIWPDYYKKCVKYEPFVKVDMTRFKFILKKQLNLV
jgi:GTP-sensing pleiotropic transcriptional regulator CodY